MRETAGEHVRRLLIGPLYANSTEIASQLLFSIFSKFYKPEEDYDFDPDIFAIYRREVHFIIPRRNVLCIELLRGFAGSGSNIRKERLYYQTAFSQVHNFMVDFKRIYAISDLHSCLI
uniref:Maturase K n=1 Tax=Acrobeloides nanus TaxID=290746 RepID=A0A914D8V4_9BILA